MLQRTPLSVEVTEKFFRDMKDMPHVLNAIKARVPDGAPRAAAWGPAQAGLA